MTPPSRNATRTPSCVGVASARRAMSTTIPMTRTLLTVPSPGRCRSGIQPSSTITPVAMVMVPNETGTNRAMPWCSTSHGMLPSCDRRNRAMLTPYRARPAYSCTSRRGTRRPVTTSTILTTGLDFHSQSRDGGPVSPRRRVSARELAPLVAGWKHDRAAGYAALAGRLRLLVLDGRVPVHVLLPSERDLAAALGTSRTTTAAAYRLLRESGFAAAGQGAEIGRAHV